MESLIQDLKYAARVLLKSPGFVAIAVLTLALGIGANTALFSVVNGVLLRPLPYPRPAELVVISETTANFESSSISYPNFLDWQRTNSSFASIAAYKEDDYSITGAGEAERVRVGTVSKGFFEILGVSPVQGRTFTADDDRLGSAPVAMISAGLWQRKFGSAPDIIGKRITMNGEGYTVIGIVPARFQLESTNFNSAKDVFVPMGAFKDPLFQRRDVHEGTRAIGRLKPGVTLDAAHADMSQIASNLALEYPDSDKGAGISLVPLKKDVVGDVQPFLLVLLGAVGFVLLIACVNVANLQLARATTRSREFAIRAALGASQSRVIRQLLTESVLLGLAGGALGLLVAAWGTQAALKILPDTLPRAQEVGVDGRVLIFTLLASRGRRSAFRSGACVKDFAAEPAGNIEREWARSERRETPGAGRLRGGGNGHGAGAVNRRGADDSQLAGFMECESGVQSAGGLDVRRVTFTFSGQKRNDQPKCDS